MVAPTQSDLASSFKEGMNFVANNDYVKAAELFNTLAAQGHMEAQFYLGLMHEGVWA